MNIELGHGTPYGIHYWMGWWECAKRAHLNTEHRGQLIGIGGSDEMRIGTITHGLLAAYYKHGYFNVEEVVYSEKIDSKLQKKAEDIFRAYRLRFAPDELGEVHAVEEVYGVAKSQRKAVSSAVGAYPLPYTFSPDLEVKISARRAIKLKVSRNITVKPGLWLVDHKGVGWLKDETRYMEGLQFIAYMMAYAEAFSAPKGLLVNAVPRAGEEYKTLVIPFPNRVRRERLKHFFTMIKEKREKMGAVWTNPAACVDGRDVCVWWERGICYGV